MITLNFPDGSTDVFFDENETNQYLTSINRNDLTEFRMPPEFWSNGEGYIRKSRLDAVIEKVQYGGYPEYVLLNFSLVSWDDANAILGHFDIDSSDFVEECIAEDDHKTSEYLCDRIRSFINRVVGKEIVPEPK